MNAKIYTTLSIFVSITAFAINDFGPLEKARKNHPAIFVPGNVIEYTIGNEIGYVYNGEAEKYFEGELGESDANLFREASLDAKKNLYNFLVKDDRSLEVQMSGARKLYEFVESKMRRVVFFVRKDRVSVNARQKRNLDASNAVVHPATVETSVVVGNTNSQEQIVAKSITNTTAVATPNTFRKNRNAAGK